MTGGPGGALAGLGVLSAGAAALIAAAAVVTKRNKNSQVAPDVEFMLARAAALQQAAGDKVVTLEHLQAALEEAPGGGSGAGGKRAAGPQPRAGPPDDGALTKKELEDTMKSLLAPPGGMSGGDPDQSPLERFTQDMTASARSGKLDPVIGRDEELRRMMHILCRRTKNNPVLVGETGVGKTALVEGLAQRIVDGDVPYSLAGCRIVELDVGALTAGAMMPGEFEDRLKAVLQEVASSRGRVLLFIDDIHNLVPAMGQQGATMMDGGSLLKPFLSRGELRCIGASSTDKFKKTIEKDPGLERRFQQVFVDQPSVPVTISILRGLRPHYERHHGVSVGEDALVAAAQLSARYIAGRFLPDKAIDLMDEATAQVKMELSLRPASLDSIDRRLRQLDSEIGQLEGKAKGGADKVAVACLEELREAREGVKEQRDVLAAAWKAEREAGQAVEELGMQHMMLSAQIEQLEEAFASGAYEADNDDDDYEGYDNGYGGADDTGALTTEGEGSGARAGPGPGSSGIGGTAASMLEHLKSRAADVSEKLAKAKAAEAAAAAGPGPEGGEARAAPAPKMIRNTVGEGDIAAVISRWTGIPVTKLVASERERLLGLQDELHRRIIGQAEAVDAVAEAVQRSRADVADLNGPIASFMFLGPTGVGKTELAKALAAYLFNTEEAMVRLDMSEYMEKHAVSRLIGAPPGYVGYEEGGMLTDSVRRRPYSVVLFDEIEKAHVDVFNVLLQILDDGRITDAQGRTVSFKNTVIIMTSNLGSSEIFAAVNGGESPRSSAPGANGGEAAGAGPGSRMDRAALKEKVMEHVRTHFRPEFINRVDEFITFDPLQPDQIKQIVALRAVRLVSRLGERRMKLELTDPAVEFLASKGYDPAYGARPVKRALQRELQTLLAQALLRNEFIEGDTITVTVREGGTGLQLTRSAAPAPAPAGNGKGKGGEAEAEKAEEGAEKEEGKGKGEAEEGKANGHAPAANGIANGHH
ncbi:hypothetical protein HYH03_011574 [Edaphochlamys debaryana]|uniref:Uncharacterized protein n=1 Tax=Edaphochlamys debaryana TaxID=47281 RepID=A0A836BVD8_9CHLO|nr:hypothetical protein HYH03_011574 [Edaphochlamys debaryana]|eukprot:KAG2489942.1 hypothetical protein HYH03_011574 [Edaphochlamys debaryana]